MPRLGNVGNLRAFPSGEAAKAAGAKGGSSPKKKATLNAKRLMRTVLMSKPDLDDKQRKRLEAIGLDLNDESLTTNAALISAVILSKALKGDLTAVRMALEMGGQPIDAKAIIELEKLKLERERFEFEKQMTLQQMKPIEETENGAPDAFITALEKAGTGISIDSCDTPEDVQESIESEKNDNSDE